MKLKELAALLHIEPANILFYAREGLWPADGGKVTRHREFSNVDAERLRTVIRLRKLGIQVETIQALFLRQIGFQEVLKDQISGSGDHAAAEVCRALLEAGVDSIDSEEVAAAIEEKESAGVMLTDIRKDWLLNEIKLIRVLNKGLFRLDEKDMNKPWWKKLFWVLFICVVSGCSNCWIRSGSFWEGFCYPLLIFCGVTVLILPIVVLNFRFPRAAQIYGMVLLWLIFGTFILLVLAIIFSAVRSCA